LGGSLRFYELFERAADRWLVSGEQEEKQEVSMRIAFSNPPKSPFVKGGL